MDTIIICIIILHDNRPNTQEDNSCFDGQLEVLSGDDEAGYSGLEGTWEEYSTAHIGALSVKEWENEPRRGD